VNANVSAEIDRLESANIARWSACCDSHASLARPLRDSLGPQMDATALKALWDCNKRFIAEAETHVSAAQQLASLGRPLLQQRMTAARHEAESTNMLIQYILISRNPPGPIPEARSAPPPLVRPQAINYQTLFGIWDLTTTAGNPAELAMDDQGNLSFVFADSTYGYWGLWKCQPIPGGNFILTINRKGIYPVRFYGPLGTKDLPFLEVEAWTTMSVQRDQVSFADVSMKRRKDIPMPYVTARISEVQSILKIADQRDAARAAELAQWRGSVSTAQAEMQKYIDSGIGRYHSK
jgi:hypothetical protein